MLRGRVCGRGAEARVNREAEQSGQEAGGVLALWTFEMKYPKQGSLTLLSCHMAVSLNAGPNVPLFRKTPH